MMIRIVEYTDGLETNSYVFDQDTVRIGRDPTNDIPLSNGYVSSRHGVIRMNKHGVVYEDFVTTNGSVLRREDDIVPVDDGCFYQVNLQDGDELLVGDARKPLVLRVALVSEVSCFDGDETVCGTGHGSGAFRGLQEISKSFDHDALLALHDMSTRVSGSLDLEVVLKAFNDCVLGLFKKANHVAVYLRDSSGDFRRTAATSREGDAPLRPLSKTLRDRVLQKREALTFMAGDEALDGALSLHGWRVRGGLCAPLWKGSDIVGIVQVDRYGLESSAFDEQDLDAFAVFANQAALMIENARMHQSLQASIEKTIQGLVRALEAADEYTSGHSEAVGDLAEIVAARFYADKADIDKVRRAALLHDLGKIGVPGELLNKQGRLSADEFERLKAHPETGARILEPFEFLSDLVPMVLHHHERFDGQGYPAALSGEDIPLGARILSVVDTYHALVSNRSYRPGVGMMTAIEELRRCTGSQFDPKVVEALAAALSEATGEDLSPRTGEEVESQDVPRPEFVA